MARLRPVILSGGSGTRLWPVSTQRLPKQFAPLLPGRPLFERALLRLAGLEGAGAPLVVTGAGQLALVEEAVRGTGVGTEVVIVEPEGRNTAPAALAAALSTSPDEIMAILPSDHLIGDEPGFAAAVEEAAGVASDGHIVTFGVIPRSPETGYGYIEAGEALGPARRVVRFVEKPTREEAVRLVGEGTHLWNSGIFVTSARTLLAEARAHCPDLLSGVSAAMAEPEEGVLRLGDGFGEVERISIDHAIMEKTRSAAVMPLDVGWDDVGSFDALWSVSDKDDRGNAVTGEVSLRDVSGSYVRATTRKVAVAGLDDVVVVETADGLLVLPRDRSQEVREIAEGLEGGG